MFARRCQRKWLVAIWLSTAQFIAYHTRLLLPYRRNSAIMATTRLQLVSTGRVFSNIAVVRTDKERKVSQVPVSSSDPRTSNWLQD